MVAAESQAREAWPGFPVGGPGASDCQRPGPLSPDLESEDNGGSFLHVGPEGQRRLSMSSSAQRQPPGPAGLKAGCYARPGYCSASKAVPLSGPPDAA